eukprot:CAMPEP_0114993284 /NCGR_PEP_ID=MMETSP0216-20121206/12440_1 /TAXON_ID=223996 /ORGANISM="Protocruzia adherens, Strain Boccale" /LENGTH=685 /DNA_ID=CAMNT_0002356901 /DNA_START=49 /DNA_END=2106 /DNA_ORIENTATION=+
MTDPNRSSVISNDSEGAGTSVEASLAEVHFDNKVLNSFSQFMEGQTDLREYSEKVENDLRGVEREAVEDFIKNQDEVAQLYKQIKYADSVLSKMDTMLSSFKSNLEGISNEIRFLQDRSMKMNISLQNRKDLEDKLDKFLQAVVLTPDMIYDLTEKEINEDYIQTLDSFNLKLRYLQENDLSNSLAMSELEPEIVKLKQKVCAKVRLFLMSKLQELRKPKTNLQILQQNVLTKFSSLMKFLKDNSTDIYFEILTLYTDIMSKIYFAYFKSYVAESSKFIDEYMSKNDQIIQEEVVQKMSIFGSSKVSTKERIDIFALNGRDTLLKEIESDPIVFHVQQKNQRVVIEKVFRSQNQLLIDTVSSEFFFAIEFFSLKADECNPVFKATFSRTLQILLDAATQSISASFDIIGILLMIQINDSHRHVMQRRRIPTLDYYFDKLNIMLWPRFKLLFDNNHSSMNRAATKKFAVQSASVHDVVRKYSDFMVMLFTLIPNNNAEMITHGVGTMRASMLQLINRLSATLKGKNQLCFVISNLEFLVSQFLSTECQNLASETEFFETELRNRLDQFSDQLIFESYSQFLEFVKEYDPEKPNAGNKKVEDTQLIERLGDNFSANLKEKLDNILYRVKEVFGQDSPQSTEIIRRSFASLKLYYEKFILIVKTHHPNYTRKLVSMMEVKDIMKKLAK